MYLTAERTKDTEKSALNPLSGKIVDCSLRVHKTLGPGLLESAYEECLIYELSKTPGIKLEKQKTLPSKYENKIVSQGYRIDLLVNDEIIVEIKAVEKILPLHEAQILTYMKLLPAPIGLIINFNQKLLKDGLRRFVL